MGEVAAATVGNIAGVKFGEFVGGLGADDGGSSTKYVNNQIGQMNGQLDRALIAALASSKLYTDKAIDQQNLSLGKATDALTQYLQQAIIGGQAASDLGFNRSQALNAPYSAAGLGALDRYQDSLGLARPEMGNLALQQSLYAKANLDPYLSAVRDTGRAYGAKNPFDTPTAPDYGQAPDISQFQATPMDIMNYLMQNSISYEGKSYYTGTGADGLGAGMGNAQNGANSSGGFKGATLESVMQNPMALLAIQKKLAEDKFNPALESYNKAVAAKKSLFENYQNAYTGLNNQLGSTNANQINAAAAYNQGLFTPVVRKDV